MPESILGIEQDSVIMKLCSNNMIKLEFDTITGKKVKHITFEQFANIIIGSKSESNDDKNNPWIISDIYPNDSNIHVVQTKVKENGKKIIVLKRDATPFTIKYHNTEYKNCGLPTLLFGIVIAANKIRNVHVLATVDKVITNKTQLYQYPFSNVGANSGRICFGANRMAEYEVDTLFKAKNIPNMFLSMPNNDDGYSGHGRSNNSCMEQRQLLEYLQDNEFKKEWLIKNNHTYETWFRKELN